MTPLNKSSYDLHLDIARIFASAPRFVSAGETSSDVVRFLLEVGNGHECASDVVDEIDDDYVFKTVEVGDSEDQALLVKAHFAGSSRLVQLVFRSPIVAGPVVVEGTVWPAHTSVNEALRELELITPRHWDKAPIEDPVFLSKPVHGFPDPSKARPAPGQVEQKGFFEFVRDLLRADR